MNSSVWLVVLGIGWLLQFLAWVLAQRRADRLESECIALADKVIIAERKQAELEAAGTTTAAELAQSAALMESTSELMPKWTEELNAARSEVDRERQKVKNLQGIIASVVAQRQFWAEWYHQQVAEHGAAQNLLTAECEKLAFHVKQLGGKAHLHPAIKEIGKQFAERHPALADAGQPAEAGQKTLEERKVEGAP